MGGETREKKMSRRRKHPLRVVREEEWVELERMSQSRSCPAVWVERAKAIVLVGEGKTYLEAGRAIGQRRGRGVAAVVERFNREGLRALLPRHGGGSGVKYDEKARERILAEVQRQPSVERDGTTSWSLTRLQRAVREAPDGLPEVSTDTIRQVLLQAGYRWQRDQTWCHTGDVVRLRKAGTVVVHDIDTDAKKKPSNRHISLVKHWASVYGVKMKPGHTRPFHILAPIGNLLDSPCITRMNIHVLEQPSC